MTPRALSIASLAALLIGCGKNEPIAVDSPAPAKSAEQSAPAPAAGGDVATVLDQLTQALRKYSAEKQRVPATLQELVAAGYLPAVPAAPGGKKFEINQKRVEVVLAD